MCRATKKCGAIIAFKYSVMPYESRESDIAWQVQLATNSDEKYASVSQKIPQHVVIIVLHDMHPHNDAGEFPVWTGYTR
jgi:hypothetical protein